MPNFRRIIFKVDDRKPESLPAVRIAAYINQVAAILGNKDNVHMVGIETRSTNLVQLIDEAYFQEAYSRARSVGDPSAPKEVQRAGRELNRMLREDNSPGRFIDDQEHEIIEIPGPKKPAPILYGPFKERGSVQGELSRIGGSGKTIPVWVVDDSKETIHCMTTSRDLAKDLARHMYEQLRLDGIGTWVREDDQNEWELKEFEAQGYDVLNDEPLLSVVSRLRAIEGSEWATMPDPLAELMRIRYGTDKED
jgi:hypothetical protein